MDTVADRAWILVVTRGASSSFAPEIYNNGSRAMLEAERWARSLVPEGREVDRPFHGRWTAGDFDVRMVEIDWLPVEKPWIGTFWDRSGIPDPEAVLLDGRNDALAWVGERVSADAELPTVGEEAWLVWGSTVVRGEQVHAVAHLAKIIS